MKKSFLGVFVVILLCIGCGRKVENAKMIDDNKQEESALMYILKDEDATQFQKNTLNIIEEDKFQFLIKGQKIMFPCKVKEILEQGLEIEKMEEESIYTNLVPLYFNKKENKYIYVNIKKGETEDEDICIRIEFDISQSQNFPISVAENITYGNTKEDLEKVYGLPTSTHRCESLAYTLYTYKNATSSKQINFYIYDIGGIQKIVLDSYE